MNTILEVKGLRKKFNDFNLQDIGFSLKEGCITGFIGINGAGKTTTIKLLLGLIIRDILLLFILDLSYPFNTSLDMIKRNTSLLFLFLSLPLQHLLL